MREYVNLTAENIENEHICCAIADKKHQDGVDRKKAWIKERLNDGHVFRKLDDRGKVFIEYTPLENAWVPVVGENYIYIHCLWVSGKFKGQGHAKDLLEYCIEDAKKQNKSGICVLSNKKKTPFLSDGKFLQHFGFQVVEELADGYTLLALSFDGTLPHFTENAKKLSISSDTLTIYYSPQCPYIINCLKEVKEYCSQHHVPIDLIAIETLEQAKQVPCVFNNWAVFYNGAFQTVHLLNEGDLKKILEA